MFQLWLDTCTVNLTIILAVNVLCNCKGPRYFFQVGAGFNRGIWNELEKYVRSIARKNRNTYVCTGPLYLPRYVGLHGA